MRKITVFILLCSFVSTFSWSQNKTKRPVSIVYIGNSITQGVLIEKPELNAPPVQSSNYLSELPDIELKG